MENIQTKLRFPSRKVAIIGVSSWISLPKDWVSTQKIVKGDKIAVFLLENGGLLLVPESREVKSE